MAADALAATLAAATPSATGTARELRRLVPLELFFVSLIKTASLFLGFFRVVGLKLGPLILRPQAADVVDQIPQVFFFELTLERRHLQVGARTVADGAIHFSVARSVLVSLGNGQIGGVGDNVELRLAVGAVAGRAGAGKKHSPLRQRRAAVRNGILEFLGFFLCQRFAVILRPNGCGAQQHNQEELAPSIHLLESYQSPEPMSTRKRRDTVVQRVTSNRP